MNLENFKQAYLKTISESDDSDLKNYIRSIVEEILFEQYTEDDLLRKIKSLDAMIDKSSGASDGERQNAIRLKQILQDRLQYLRKSQRKQTNKFEDILKSYGFDFVDELVDGALMFKNSAKDEIYIYPETKSITLFSFLYKKNMKGTFKNLDTWMSNNTVYEKSKIPK
jgi:hypothetical protein